MNGRAKEVESTCFLIFEEKPKSAAGDSPALNASKKLEIPAREPAVTEIGGNGVLRPDSGFLTNNGPGSRETSPESQPEPDSSRFVQFLFNLQTFVMDLPNTTLFEPEIELLQRDRAGFVREARIGRPLTFHDHVKIFDPVRKEYLYEDEQSAAEDTAYIFFDLWRFPVDSRLFVEAAAFDGPHRWEWGYPIE